MRLRWWECALLLLPLVLAALFFAAGLWVGGVVLVCLSVFVATSRAQIVERNVAGFHAQMRGRLITVRVFALLAIYGLLIYGFFVMAHEHWTRDRRGLVAFYASAGLALFLLRDIHRYGNDAVNYLIGGEEEEAVAVELDRLRDDGWLVLHNVLRVGGGNVDHFLKGPYGAYVVETKSGRHRVADRGQTISNAIWAKRQFGERWVIPILCVGTEPPAEPQNIRHGKSDMWVMGKKQLRHWLLAQR
jgi:hypothetical protein